MFDDDVLMGEWALTSGTLEAAVMALTPDEKATGLRILRKLKADVYTNADSAGVKPYEWDGQTAENLLEAFEYAAAGQKQDKNGTESND